jgi:hypothetical protein
MPATIFGSQFFSCDGSELRDMRSFTSICATQDIDLVSHLIPAGEYSLTVNVVMGQVNIFVPKHMRIIIDGTVLFGSSTFHDDTNGWNKFARNFRTGLTGKSRHGFPGIAFPDTSGQVRLRIRINGFLGAVRVYRLAHEAELLRPGMVAVGV